MFTAALSTTAKLWGRLVAQLVKHLPLAQIMTTGS